MPPLDAADEAAAVVCLMPSLWSIALTFVQSEPQDCMAGSQNLQYLPGISCHTCSRGWRNAFMPALSVASPLQDVEQGVEFAARGRECRSIFLPEPQLYRGAQLVIPDSRGNQYIALPYSAGRS